MGCLCLHKIILIITKPLQEKTKKSSKSSKKIRLKGLKFAQEFLAEAERNSNLFYETEALSLIDAVYMNTNEYKKLLQSCEKTISKAKQINNFRREIEASVRKSWALMHLGLLEEAKKILDDTALILPKLDQSNDGGFREYWQILDLLWRILQRARDGSASYRKRE